jgi:hypothetical protein
MVGKYPHASAYDAIVIISNRHTGYYEKLFPAFKKCFHHEDAGLQSLIFVDSHTISWVDTSSLTEEMKQKKLKVAGILEYDFDVDNPDDLPFWMYGLFACDFSQVYLKCGFARVYSHRGETNLFFTHIIGLGLVWRHLLACSVEEHGRGQCMQHITVHLLHGEIACTLPPH